MADPEKWEVLALQQEFDWILQYEVPSAIRRLRVVIEECARHFPQSVGKIVTPPKLEKFVMATASHNAQDSIKCIVTVLGDNITHADINIKLHKNTSQYHGQLQTEWKLQQTQDSANHLQTCCYYLDNLDDGQVKSAEEAMHALQQIISYLHKGRNALIIPKKRTIDDLVSSRNMKSLIPNLPSDLTISFYIQAHKLIFAVYLLSQQQGHVRFDTFQAECSVPWLNEVIVLYSDALQLCQQLKDKITVFSQYKDANLLGSHCASPDSWEMEGKGIVIPGADSIETIP